MDHGLPMTLINEYYFMLFDTREGKSLSIRIIEERWCTAYNRAKLYGEIHNMLRVRSDEYFGLRG